MDLKITVKTINTWGIHKRLRKLDYTLVSLNMTPEINTTEDKTGKLNYIKT